MLAMPWIATGVFVYQSFITDIKNCGNIYTIPKAFMIYSITFNRYTLFFSGFLVDKFTVEN